MVAELTGMDLANASLLDEATAVAEAMTLLHRVTRGKNGDCFLMDSQCHPQTMSVVQTRAEPIGLETVLGDPATAALDGVYAVVVQYPGTTGAIPDLASIVERCHANDTLVAVAADPLALIVLAPPGEIGADVVVGSTQRFGIPMGFGGPHAAYFAVRSQHQRSLPGRLVGVSRDTGGRKALRLALQTREQHIRREKATSNICTSQVLLAVMASMYAIHHGPVGLRRIAMRVNRWLRCLPKGCAEVVLRSFMRSFSTRFVFAFPDVPTKCWRSHCRRESTFVVSTLTRSQSHLTRPPVGALLTRSGLLSVSREMSAT